ncbi:MAG: proline racemase family protein [Mariniblastus sp.]|nr:proline racemase family protein [Mariniblastus sp.]
MSFDSIDVNEKLRRFQAGVDWQRIVTVDMHTGGEPLRIVASGYPVIPGRNSIERREYCANELDHLRKLIMWEPRGHADMYGCILTPPNEAFDDVQADFGVLFMHNEGYSSMCGHGIIAVTKLAIESGLVPAHEGESMVRIDAPAGRITAMAKVEQGCVTSVSFENVPCFVQLANQRVKLDPFGEVEFDLAYGGAFYAYLDAGQLGLELSVEAGNVQRLIQAGREIKKSIQQNFDIRHPVYQELSFLYGAIFSGPPHDPAHHSRNVCVFADGEVDRCPTGTGVSGRAAIEYARGDLALGESITIESILGTTFDVCPIRETRVDQQLAVVPRVTGSAYFTGRNEFWVDPADSQGRGFLVSP